VRSSVFSHRLRSSKMPTQIRLPMQPTGAGRVRICAKSSVITARSVVILLPTVQRRFPTTARNEVTLSNTVPLGLHIAMLLLIRLQ
jgi:hypothetical protein